MEHAGAANCNGGLEHLEMHPYEARTWIPRLVEWLARRMLLFLGRGPWSAEGKGIVSLSGDQILVLPALSSIYVHLTWPQQ